MTLLGPSGDCLNFDPWVSLYPVYSWEWKGCFCVAGNVIGILLGHCSKDLVNLWSITWEDLYLRGWSLLFMMVDGCGQGPGTELLDKLLLPPPGFLPNPQAEDVVLWIPSPTSCYPTQSAWAAIRSVGQKKPWCSLVWFQRNVPKWAFIAWLAFSKKLATKDRLRNWGMAGFATRVLCQQSDDSHAHLLFDCIFTRTVLADVLWRNLIQRSHCDWDFEVGWACLHYKGNSLRSSLCKLALAATLYHAWVERNSRIFAQQCCSSAVDVAIELLDVLVHFYIL